MLYVGTAGFSYSDWREVFYPESVKPQDYLRFYSEHFPCVELNFTYYRQPSPENMRSMTFKVPDDFRFTVKAHKTMTHEIGSQKELEHEFETFKQGVWPMYESGKLGCILFQFPWSFKPSNSNLEYVLSLKKRVPYAQAVVEFRNALWANDQIYHSLEREGIGFCCVDEPDLKGLFPRVSVVTSEIGYLRFHGRNKEKWFNHKEAWERYDYLYTDDELQSWVPDIEKMAQTSKDMYVIFNNCHRGQAGLNAKRMQELLMLPFE
ncbi:MAG TPA: DUF72 domain-containing protein [Bacillota bacterium]|nr:DUF72 domain-containing protein [Candidatus Fermentithermobacillaceae bacterium]HOB30863.1 DUF72 domain-containing protein [Bacillota bacterium]HOQ02247.1 DUF72 domain-containing protein [Bacillota bacterium]HPV12684.1 DUF72 domain-containing protein [Bacillota bacterium]HPZ78191.1 DUF72 domain-containing protein [Bacillota bacterium]